MSISGEIKGIINREAAEYRRKRIDSPALEMAFKDGAESWANIMERFAEYCSEGWGIRTDGLWVGSDAEGTYTTSQLTKKFITEVLLK